jgi:hypothetical protein
VVAQRRLPEDLGRIVNTIEIWNRAVQVQAARALGAPDGLDQVVDGLLLALALRNLLRTVEWAERVANSAHHAERSSTLRAARAHFDAAIPDVVDMRDLISHCDAYEGGEGKLPKVTFSLWFEAPEGETTLWIDYYRLPVRAAAEQAQQVVQRAMQALLSRP